MDNPNNKTSVIKNFDLEKYKTLIENFPCHIASVNCNGNPNLSVADHCIVLSKNKILLPVIEMVNTPDCVKNNSNIVLTFFNEAWAGIRLSGTATFETEGKWYNYTIKNYTRRTTPFGAILVKVNEAEGIA